MNLYYLGKGKNFGDAVNYEIFTKLFNQDVKRTKYYTADFMATGSILGKILYNTRTSTFAKENLRRSFYSITLRHRPIHILGSGFIEDVTSVYPQLKLFRPVDVVALRGEKTRRIMELILERSLKDIALGDPGILTSELIKREQVEKKYRLGIIPHAVDQTAPLLDEFKLCENTRILDIKSDPYDFMRNVAACETIASSTLHGLIAAHSLHIPALWIRFSDKLLGGDFKFHDYYSVFGITPDVTDLRHTGAQRITPQHVLNQPQPDPADIERVKSRLTQTFQLFFQQDRRH